ncbi:MAG: N,N-dimethylformamidase beta subunit family domain-containing protein [Actinomycetes bacterium]
MRMKRLKISSSSRRSKILAGLLSAIVVGSAAFGANYYILHRTSGSAAVLPPLKPHGDIPLRQMTTYAETLNQELPADSVEVPSNCPVQKGDWVTAENDNAGIAMTSTDWSHLNLMRLSGSVLWVDRQSATCGDRIGIHASLFPRKSDGLIDTSPRSFEVLRIGWYGGSGARMVWNSGPVKLKYRNTPTLRNATRTIETKWPISSSFDIGPEWVPGLYLVASVNPQGKIENVAPFILRSNPQDSKLLLIHSTLTWAAYNSFGGHSAYSTDIKRTLERSQVVSFDRPYAGSGINHISRDAISFVQYLESTGLNIDQVADTDITNSPSIAAKYSGIIFSGHPEYMTRTEFDTVAAVRNLGVNIAFMGANNAFWQSRVEASPSGPDRRLVIYRDPRLDPQTDWQKVSIQFGNKRINTPPSLLTGEEKAGVHVTGSMSAVSIPHWLDIPMDATLTGWSSNSEIDSIATGEAAPPKVNLIFSGKFELVNPTPRALTLKRSLMGQTIWFTAPSGSATFVAGINYWPCETSFTCLESRVDDATRFLLQSITAQVLTLWQTKAVGKSLK